MGSSRKAKILVTETMPLFEEERKILEKIADVKVAEDSTEEILISEVADVDIIMVVYAKITGRVIDSAKKLKGIVRYGIGVDNIDLEAASRRKIPVANVPDYCIETVADHTFALILALVRKILVADKTIRSGKFLETWTSPSVRIRGLDLKDKTMGIIGMGKIGRSVAARANGFGMKVIAHDPYVTKEFAESIKVILVDLNHLLQHSDFVSIHAPLIPETRGMINEKELKMMKKTAYLINVARGLLIDEKALVKALKEKWISGAGVDVYQEEPPKLDNPLFRFENVVLTPHVAWYTEEAVRRLEMSAVKEATNILKGKLPKNLVNKNIL